MALEAERSRQSLRLGPNTASRRQKIWQKSPSALQFDATNFFPIPSAERGIFLAFSAAAAVALVVRRRPSADSIGLPEGEQAGIKAGRHQGGTTRKRQLRFHQCLLFTDDCASPSDRVAAAE